MKDQFCFITFVSLSNIHYYIRAEYLACGAKCFFSVHDMKSRKKAPEKYKIAVIY